MGDYLIMDKRWWDKTKRKLKMRIKTKSLRYHYILLKSSEWVYIFSYNKLFASTFKQNFVFLVLWEMAFSVIFSIMWSETDAKRLLSSAILLRSHYLLFRMKHCLTSNISKPMKSRVAKLVYRTFSHNPQRHKRQ